MERHRTTDERLAAIETSLETLSHYLMGNGQKGVIEKMDDRISILEQFRWQFAGGFALIAGGLAVVELILHLKGK